MPNEAQWNLVEKITEESITLLELSLIHIWKPQSLLPPAGTTAGFRLRYHLEKISGIFLCGGVVLK